MLDSKNKHLVSNLRYFDRNTKSRDGILTRIKKKRFKVKTNVERFFILYCIVNCLLFYYQFLSNNCIR